MKDTANVRTVPILSVKILTISLSIPLTIVPTVEVASELCADAIPVVKTATRGVIVSTFLSILLLINC
jgi:hypothetical protein